MSLAKLTLRPPPNIDFVQGYPGIPPGGADRPQAAVKGAIEVRVGGQGVKAKWVRIELKKVEVLPGGNTFYDYVGQSPINVWQATEEYGTLHTQDFPFYIRIPESIPPSIALEKGAGIRYELIAAVCLKGKRGLLRRDKPTITTASSTIIIDKHELHSTWPIYQQPETRSHVEGDVTLFVERTRTCFGPGDRMSVKATVKAEKDFKDTLRGFELTLRETTVFRGGPHSTSKKGAPVVKVVHISEQRVPLNAALFGGMQHKAELFVNVPAQHTSATLNTARHIDITYHLVVKALMATTTHVSLDLPVVVSNWPKSVSLEAMRRIGLAPNVSIPGASLSSSVASTATSPPLIGQQILKTQTRPDTANSNPQVDVVIGRPSIGQYNTAPERINGNVNGSRPDEFGVTRITGDQESHISDERSERILAQTIGGTLGLSASIGSGAGRVAPQANEATAIPRPRAGSTVVATERRLTVRNFNEAEAAEHQAQERATNASRASSTSAVNPAASRPATVPTQDPLRPRVFMTAEEEKRQLYERAVAKVEERQGITLSHPLSPIGSAQASFAPSTPPNNTGTAPAPTTPPTQTAAPKPKNRWLTAEEEKAKLFEAAQARVAITQGFGNTGSPAASLHGRSGSVASQSPASSPQMRALEPGPAPRTPPAQGSSSGANNASSPQTPVSTRSRVPVYPSAEEEKAAMRRFYEAKAAVDRTQETAYGVSPMTAGSSPMPYDALYPAKPASPPPPANGGSPPPFAPSSSQPSYLSEKERLRRDYEARDAAAMGGSPPAPPRHNTPPMSAVGSPGYQPQVPAATPAAVLAASAAMSSAAAEKEMLRRKFEAQDNGVKGPPPTPPPRSGSFSAGSRTMATPPRSPPVPPGSSSGSRPLTAAEEKAQLRARYDSENRAGSPPNGSPVVQPIAPLAVNGTSFVAPPPPPPLAPKPPKEYIQETQEEDMRTHARLQAIDREISAAAPRKTEVILSSFSADFDSTGNPLPPGPPPQLAQPTRMPITIE